MKGHPSHWTTLKKLCYLKAAGVIGGGPSWLWQLVTGTAPLALLDAVAKPLKSLTQYGKCVQSATPTPDNPVDIVCNNGRVVAGNCISSIPDGQGTFITPSDSNTTRIYKAFPTGLIAGRSYTVTVTGANWSIIVQRKKPDGTDWSNVSAWVTTYEFVPEAGYVYGIALRIGGGTATITPADFNGTLTLDTTDGKPWAAGTPETLTVTDADGNTQTATVQNLFAIPGTDYADTQEIINGPVGRKVLCLVLDGVTAGRKLSESWNATYKRGNLSVSGMLQSASSVADAMCTRFDYSASVYGAPTKDGFCTNSGVVFFTFIEDADVNSAADGNAKFAAWYAEGKPAMLFVPLAEETTEQGTAHSLHTSAGNNVVSVTSNVDPVQLEIEYAKESA